MANPFRLRAIPNPSNPNPSSGHRPSPCPGGQAGDGDAAASRGGRDGAAGGARGQRVVGRRRVAGADVVGVRVPRGVVQLGGDTAVARVRGVPGVAGPVELPQDQLRPLTRHRRRLLRSSLGRSHP
jgi:hypothetical protein